MLTSEQLAWAAGFVDGEGCFTMRRQRNRQSVQYYPMVCVTNTDLRPLQRLSEMFGGAVYVKSKGDDKRAKSYAWHLYSKAAVECARKLHPHLVVKAEQAALFILYHTTTRRANAKMDAQFPEEAELRILVREKITALNKRGPSRVRIA